MGPRTSGPCRPRRRRNAGRGGRGRGTVSACRRARKDAAAATSPPAVKEGGNISKNLRTWRSWSRNCFRVSTRS